MRATLAGEPPIEMQIRRVARARRISLRVSGRDGRVTLTMPPGASVDEAMGFAHTKEAWLRRTLAELPRAERPEHGGQIMIEGRPTPILASKALRVALVDGELHVPQKGDAGPQIATFLKRLARNRAEAATARHAAAIRRAPPRLTLRDTRSRWGSCTAEGKVMLSWRLVMAPPEILDYVAAHEVAHLIHMDHSSDFWALTERLYPGWKGARRWLRAHGAHLQSVDFS